MKKVILSTIALVLLFAAGSWLVTASAWVEPAPIPKVNSITYEVNIHMVAEADLCNTYAILLKNESGNLVAPPQAFYPTRSKYSFYEKGPVYGKRTATMVVVPTQNPYTCPVEMYVNPDSKTGWFLNGAVYNFDLYPSGQKPPH